MSALARMEDRDATESNGADALGFVGLAFAVMGFCDLPLGARLTCLLGGFVLLPVSFLRQNGWPGWVRWMLSLIVIFLGYVTWSAMRAH